jgi:thioredoxin 2
METSSVVKCTSCGKHNRVPLASGGTPRCAACHTDLPWLVEADDGTFAEAITTGRLVLVDLWAPWCGPCQMVAPILATLSQDYAGLLKVVKVNVDIAPQTAQRFRASSIPMLLMLRDSAVVETVVGAQPEHVLRAQVERHLNR